MMSSKGLLSGGRLKVVLPGVMVAIMSIIRAIEAVINYFELAWRISDTSHAFFATLILALFVTYVLTDMIRYSHQTKVILAGVAAILFAGYWWIGFLARHGIPTEPLLPYPWLYPANGVYLLLALYIGFWAGWDMKAAYAQVEADEEVETPDQMGVIFGGGFLMIGGILLALYITWQTPAA